ncbi:MAG TPA: Holliday junction branch migration protein RuvA [Ignavibacteria bacterium]|nr:Holliday junction branch migration protein RuvA [Ignavibacteria bacterium]HMR40985.1 Holliday junction branch migration protein RuvA [Ignavibacteria bacterium]
MISSLKGKLVNKNNNEIILDVNGVGYHIFISKSVGEKLTELNSEYSVITHLDVKENSLQLFGFFSEKEKEVFKLLISVSGIGPRLAHTILTHLSFDEIIGIISDSSVLSGIKIPGIGVKKLELISMTLKDKIYKIGTEADPITTDVSSVPSGEFTRLDALNALMNLGYLRNEAEKLIREVLKQNGDRKLSTEEIIRKSLEFTAK